MVYVGSTNGQISLYKLDAAQGALTFVKSIAAGNYPSFLAFDAPHNHLYAVNEPDAKIAAFSVNPATGDLTLLNRLASGGDGPAFVGLDRTNKFVMVANYDGGTASVFAIGADGSLGSSPKTVSPGKATHMILTDPANKFAFVMNLESNTVAQYSFDASTGALTPNSVATIKTPSGSGPRHLAFHPNGKFAYLLHETDDSLSVYSYDAALGQLSTMPVQTLSTLGQGANAAKNSCAEVVFAPTGNFVYASNRGDDSIATFSVDGTSGMMKLLGTTPSGGQSPRSFTLSTDGKSMLVANESGNVTAFSVDVTTGALSKGKSIDVPKMPQFVGIVNWAAAQ
jgi:6-phosphogluconolactonase